MNLEYNSSLCKRVLLTILSLFLFVSLYPQKLSITDLTNIVSQSSYEKAESILTAKGWMFYKADNDYIDGNKFQTIEFAYGLTYNDRAQAWIMLWCYRNRPCEVSYQMFDNEYFPKIRGQIQSAGFKSGKTKFEEDVQKTEYFNDGYYLTLTNKTKKNDYYETSNIFVFTILRKGSEADERNGYKEEYVSGYHFKYNLKNGLLEGKCEVYRKRKHWFFGLGKSADDEEYLKYYSANFVKGREFGQFKMYDAKGRLAYDGQMKDGNFTGKVKVYDLFGKHIIQEGTFTNRMPLRQEFISTGMKSRPCSEYDFVGIDDFTGVIHEYYSDTLTVDGNVTKGKFTGWEYLKKGLENIFRLYDYDDFEKQTEQIDFIDSNKEYYNVKVSYKDNKPHGNIPVYDIDWNKVMTLSYNNGILKSYKRYEDGLLIEDGITDSVYGFSGIKREYDRDGNLTKEYNLKNDTIIGERKTYHSNGKIKATEKFVMGELDGPYKEYDENGNLVYECSYSEGYPNGAYSKNANDTIETGFYKMGKLDGKVSGYWNSPYTAIDSSNEKVNIKFKWEYIYVDGEKNGEFHHDYSDSCIWGTYANGKLEGEYTSWYPDWKSGNMGYELSKGYYHSGKKDGKWRYGNYNNQTVRIENYKNGSPNGKWEYYDDVKGNGNYVLYKEENYKDGKLDGQVMHYIRDDSYKGIGIVNVADEPVKILAEKSSNKRQYNSNWQKMYVKYNYLDGEKYGTFELKDSLDNDIEKGQFIHNMKTKEWSIYNDGKLFAKIDYSYDEPNSIKYYNSDLENCIIEEFYFTTGNNIRHVEYNGNYVYDIEYNSWQSFVLKNVNVKDFNSIFKENKSKTMNGNYIYKDSQNDKVILSGKMEKNKRIGVWQMYYHDIDLLVETDYSYNGLETFKQISSMKLCNGKVEMPVKDRKKEIISVKNGIRNGKTVTINIETKKPIEKITYKNGVEKK